MNTMGVVGDKAGELLVLDATDRILALRFRSLSNLLSRSRSVLSL